MTDFALPLVLASTSIYRQQLLSRFGIPFETAKPEVDETPLPNEPAAALAQRLAETKAKALANHFPKHLLIGSDQTAGAPDGTILGKPHCFERAFEQLKSCSGKAITFYTGLCLYNSRTQKTRSILETYTVHFRNLKDPEIASYLLEEQPYDCAGSFKMEGKGICLFQRLEGKDPNTLIGLPLIGLMDLLLQEGINPLTISKST